MSTIKEALNNDLAYHTRETTSVFNTINQLSGGTFPVDVLSREGFYVSGYGTSKGKLYVFTKDFGKDARALLPVVGKWEKSVHDNHFHMTGTVLGEFEIVLYGEVPSECKVEIVEEDVYVPEVPAHYDTRRTYKVSGCEPVLQGDGDGRDIHEYHAPDEPVYEDREPYLETI